MSRHGIMRKGSGRLVWASTAVMSLGLALGAATAVTAQANPAPHVSVTLCHRVDTANGGNQHNGYSVVTVSIGSVADAKNARGHDLHGGDIIPAYDYAYSTKKGGPQVVHYPGKNLSGNEAFLTNGCNNGENQHQVTVTPPTFTPGTCAAAGSFVLPVSDFYHWDSSGPDTARIVTAVAANNGITLIGQRVFGPFDLTKLPQLDPQSAACLPPPPTTATLNLVKVVDNTLGGAAAASAWSLTATGLTTFSGAGSASSAVLPGTYTLSESTGPTGYTPSAWACSPVANIGATVTLAAGQTETCTITNTFATIVPPVVEPPVVAPPVVLGAVVTAPKPVVKGAVVTKAPVVAGAQVTQLAFTGAETLPLGLSGLLALLMGAGLIATTRRQGRRTNN